MENKFQKKMNVKGGGDAGVGDKWRAIRLKKGES